MLRRLCHVLSLIALATATPALAQTEAPAPAPANNDIVVTARSLAQTAADLALLAEITLARIEREVGNNDRTNRLVARFTAGQGSRRPLLISSEPIRLPSEESGEAREQEGGSALARMQVMAVDNRWIDVGFWINGDGRVTDFEVLRSSGDNDWSRYVATSVNSRVYTPIRSTDGLPSQGFYMVERYTLTADLTDECTGSHIRCRSPRLRVERMDMTPTEGAAG